MHPIDQSTLYSLDDITAVQIDWFRGYQVTRKVANPQNVHVLLRDD